MSGTGTAAATSIILIGLMVGLILGQPSLDRASDDLKEARRDSSFLLLEQTNTGIAISSSVFNNTTAVLNTTIENTGTTVIDIDEIDMLLNGTWRTWSMSGIDYIYPGTRGVARMTNVTEPVSVKVVVRNGVSAHTNDILEIT